ncbi:MAG TPA: coproporphyrinogen III oxidase [Marinagarivorans sp.]
MSQRKTASSPKATAAREIIEGLQHYFVSELSQQGERLNTAFKPFAPIEWLRDAGVHGGGVRYMAQDALFNRASVNMSQVFYEDLDNKPLNSATAISTIIHPRHARTPSIHMHISWTELKSGEGYWRLMADLNPAINNDADKQFFAAALEAASGEFYADGAAQGDRYFYIPALGRHRGITHFYLEQFTTGDWQADCDLADRFGRAAIDAYCQLFYANQTSGEPVTAQQQRQQLDYHTLYFLQVLTLDRGTTSGLLSHSHNDVGTLGSLPHTINRSLLASWVDVVPAPQGELLRAFLTILPEGSEVEIDDAVKQQLADAVRAFYQQHPQAIDLQARGDVIPPTLQNHGTAAK